MHTNNNNSDVQNKNSNNDGVHNKIIIIMFITLL